MADRLEDASPRFAAALEFGCVDLRIHPNERIRGFYAAHACRGRMKYVLDVRGYSPDMKREIMDALESCWDDDVTDDRCHRRTLGLMACAEALRGTSAETFVGMTAKELPDDFLKNDKLKKYSFDLLSRPRSMRAKADDDLWSTEDLPIPPERKNDARRINFLNFSSVIGEGNKAVLKGYVMYRIRETTATLGSISNLLSKLRTFEAFLEGAPFEGVIAEDLELFEQSALSTSQMKYVSTKMVEIRALYTWMVEAEYMDESPFDGYVIKNDYRREVKSTAPSDYIVNQIRMVLPGMPFDLSLQYIILKCTGMRVSELCLLRRNCLERDSEGNCFIRFWCQKMCKDVHNIIPESLHAMIAEYDAMLPPERKYLFESTMNKGWPMPCGTVVSRMNRAFADMGIVNPDGTQYEFTPHSLRHKMAVQLAEIDAPYAVIREQLHHASYEMPVAYVEFDMKRRREKAARFIDANGIEAPLFIATAEDVIDDKVEWMKKRLSAQLLPNGVCSRPVVLGECGKCNACLECPDFRTSSEFLPVHREHLGRARSFIEAAKAAGWTSQLEPAIRLKSKLEKIIENLEK